MSEKTISDIIGEHETNDLYIAIIDALSKQIPKEAKKKEAKITIGEHAIFCGDVFRCPVCDTNIYNAITKQNYCHNCGQKLEWGGK